MFVSFGRMAALVVCAGVWVSCGFVGNVEQQATTDDFVRTVPQGFVGSFVVDVGDGRVVLIDVGTEAEPTELIAALDDDNVADDDIVAALLTHAHGDHVAGLAHFSDVTSYIHPDDGEEALAEAGVAPNAVYNIVDGTQSLQMGTRTFVIVAMPGHSPGSVAIYVDGMLFLGDSAFAKEDGRIDLAPAVFGDDLNENRRSLVRLSDWVRDHDVDVERMFFSHTGSVAGAAALHDFADAHRDLL